MLWFELFEPLQAYGSNAYDNDRPREPEKLAFYEKDAERTWYEEFYRDRADIHFDTSLFQKGSCALHSR